MNKTSSSVVPSQSILLPGILQSLDFPNHRRNWWQKANLITKQWLPEDAIRQWPGHLLGPHNLIWVMTWNRSNSFIDMMSFQKSDWGQLTGTQDRCSCSGHLHADGGLWTHRQRQFCWEQEVRDELFKKKILSTPVGIYKSTSAESIL